MRKILLSLMVLLAVMPMNVKADEPTIKFNHVFRTVDGHDLKIHIYYPKGWTKDGKYPALLAYHGGGWVKGGAGHFAKQAQHFSKRGMVSICFTYRLIGKQATTVDQCLVDAKAGYQWAFEYAAELGIDTKKMVLMGGSAGGHLASAVALCANPATGSKSLPVKPYAMILYNPVVDVPVFCGVNAKRGKSVAGVDAVAVSPAHQVSNIAPPTLVLHGTADPVVPFKYAQKFVDDLQAVGVDATMIEYEGRKHGFFNKKKGQEADHKKSIADADEFLVRLGLLKAKS